MKISVLFLIPRLALNIAKKYQDPNAKIQCCSTDGCNWSWNSATNNQALGAITSSTETDEVFLGYLGVILGIIIVILLSLLCCFIYYWRKSQEDDDDFEDAKDENVMRDRFYGRNSSFNYSNFDSRPGSNDSSDRNTVASVGLAGPSPTTGEPRRLI